MLEKLILTAGLLLTIGGYALLRTSRNSGNSLAFSLALMGAGVLLLMLPGYRFASAALDLLPGLGGSGDKRLTNELKEMRLRYLCIAAAVTGLVCLQLAPGGVNRWSVGFLALVLGSGLVYAAGYARFGGPGAAGNVIRLFLGGAAFLVFIVSGVTLITHLSGASDMPTRWNVYSYLGAAGLPASIYGFYYSLAYQTNADLMHMLEPLGFTLADSGLLGRDGRFDARGTWEGVETLVNIDQTEHHKSAPAGFFLEVSCAVPGWSGRRLLLHPGNYFNRPLGAPLTLPKVTALPGWEGYGVYCDPPEAAQPLLAALGGQDGPVRVAGARFSYLLLDDGRLTAGLSGEGHPSLEQIKRVMTAAARSAKGVS